MTDIQSEITKGEAASQDMATCMDKFARSFEASARRWELVVYPSLLAFIILAAYGFYLIYTLTSDVTRLAQSMETVVISMSDVAANMNSVSGNVAHISGNLSTIATDVGSGSNSMEDLLVKMEHINTSVGVMTVPMYDIRNSMGNMNNTMHDATGPMKMMGGIFPF
jgi:uncharacterized phage infection (PIP) family protein YhgE